MSHPDEPTSWSAFEADLSAALALDGEERDSLASLGFAATWRTPAASASEARWGWLALLGVVSAFLAWSFAAQPIGDVLGLASLVGLGTILLTTTVGWMLAASQA